MIYATVSDELKNKYLKKIMELQQFLLKKRKGILGKTLLSKIKLPGQDIKVIREKSLNSQKK